MSLSQEALEFVAKGLGRDPENFTLDSGRVFFIDDDCDMDSMSIPEVAAACKAKLRETVGFEYRIEVVADHSAIAQIFDYRENGKGLAKHDWRIAWQMVAAGDDDEAMVRAFAQAVAKGAL